MTMKCPKCKKVMKRIEVEIEGARSKASSYQCPGCGYLKFEKKSSEKVVAELRESEPPLRMEQTVIRLSKGRVGMYFNRHIAKSLKLKPGKKIAVSVPSKKHMLLEIED